MAETTISARVPMGLKHELEQYMKKEHVERSVAVRKLLRHSLQKWREERAIDMLVHGEATFLAAARFAGQDVWTFSEKVKQAGHPWMKDKARLENEIAQAKA